MPPGARFLDIRSYPSPPLPARTLTPHKNNLLGVDSRAMWLSGGPINAWLAGVVACVLGLLSGCPVVRLFRYVPIVAGN